MSVVITLVHGTFGRLFGKDAAWTRQESLLRQRLGAVLGSDAALATVSAAASTSVSLPAGTSPPMTLPEAFVPSTRVAASFLALCGYLYLLSQARQREATAWPQDWMYR